LKKLNIKIDEKELGSVKQVTLDLYEKSVDGKMVLDTPSGYHIEVDRRKEREAGRDSRSPPAVLDKLAFSESYQYIQEAKARFDTKTAVGYSGCKANCRNALMSALKTLTGKEKVREAATELSKQGILGKREEEFTETFEKLLVLLHGLNSKKGSHPPMTRNEDDAELALGLTTSILNYVTNEAIRQRD